MHMFNGSEGLTNYGKFGREVNMKLKSDVISYFSIITKIFE